MAPRVFPSTSTSDLDTMTITALEETALSSSNYIKFSFKCKSVTYLSTARTEDICHFVSTIIQNSNEDRKGSKGI